MAGPKTKTAPVATTEKKKRQPRKKELAEEGEAPVSKTKKVAKKSNIPVIKRPRGLTSENFEQYMASVQANLEYRLNELEALHADGCCPHKAVQHLRSVQREYTYIQKRFAPLTKRRRKQVDKSNNILMKNTEVSPKLATFLKLKKGELVSRSACNTAITMYINIKDVNAVAADKKKWVARMNPGGKRNLQDSDVGSIIHPDKALSELLEYPAYQKRVKAGKQVWHRRDKETNEPVDVVETDDKLTYAVVQHLLAPHFPKSGVAAKPVRKVEPVEASEESAAEEENVDSDSDE